jgi:murein DD-endopeptidase MepM/ murein hydrolase activator NlpD
MKRAIPLSCCLACLLSLPVLLGQNQSPQQQEDNKAVAEQLEKHYNAEDYEGIFSSFSEAMKEALPLEKSKQFFSDVNNQYGKIVARELIRYGGNTAYYKTRCERGTFTLTLTLGADGKIIGMFIRPYLDVEPPKMERTKTDLILPFNGEWTLGWGGDTPEQNYHVKAHSSQRHAIDFVIKDENGRTSQTPGESNADFYAFGKELIAPCGGEIVLVVDGVKDNKPEQMNPFFPTGNTVVLKTDNLEYIVFAHFKQHSIKVKQGQRVKQGDLLGLCGNSGNSSEPHLHFHVQNTEDMNIATGVKCYFAEIIVFGETCRDYSPVRSDSVRNK